MLDVTKLYFGDGLVSKKRKFLGLTDEMEQSMFDGSEACKCERMVDVAARLRDILVRDELTLSRKEKVRVLKMITRAKVRAFMHGTSTGFSAFRSLDSISNDVVRLL